MLSDPLTVVSLGFASGTEASFDEGGSFAVTDIAPGRSVRVCGALASLDDAKGKLTIAHSVSNENNPIKTDRTLVRLDVTGSDSSTSGGREVTGYAYLVVGAPRSFYANGTALTAREVAKVLLGFLMANAAGSAFSYDRLDRVLAGEP